jgi:hypothetical protein
MTEPQDSHSRSELVAYHKGKRIFLNLKDIANEDTNEIIICEFRGQDFEVITDQDY